MKRTHAPRSHRAPAPIQAKLTLQGDHALKQQNLADLNHMLRGVAAEVELSQSGEVRFKRRPRIQRGIEHEGYRLLQSLIDHRHHVRVGYDPEQGDGKAKADDPDKATKKRQGSGAYVNMSRGFSSRDIVQDEHGAITEQATPRFMALAHELIHTHHFAHGKRATGGRVEHRINGTFEGHALNIPAYGAREEEANTVGLGGRGIGGITENALRQRLGMPTRPIYESNTAGAFDYFRSSQGRGASQRRGSGAPVRRRRGSADLSSVRSAPIDFRALAASLKKPESKGEDE